MTGYWEDRAAEIGSDLSDEAQSALPAATRIMIVEDHALFAQALEVVLRQRLFNGGSGVELVREATVADGLRIADRDGPFDLAVVDLILPDGNGSDLARRIKAAHPQTRVAILSAVADLTGSLLAGADEAMSKMDSLPEILARLEALACDAAGPPAM